MSETFKNEAKLLKGLHQAMGWRVHSKEYDGYNWRTKEWWKYTQWYPVNKKGQLKDSSRYRSDELAWNSIVTPYKIGDHLRHGEMAFTELVDWLQSEGLSVTVSPTIGGYHCCVMLDHDQEYFSDVYTGEKAYQKATTHAAALYVAGLNKGAQ